MQVAPHLSARVLAKALDDLRSWQLPGSDDAPGLHRGVLRALLAMDTLTRLELPRDLAAPRPEAAVALLEWSVIASLLHNAEGLLFGAAHRSRIARLHGFFPGHAAELDRARRKSAVHVRALRQRVDFVCRNAGAAPAPIEALPAPHLSFLQ